MLLDHENGITSVVDCSYATKLAVEPFPETLVEIDGKRGHDQAGAGLSAHGDRQERHRRARCLAAAAALGVASRHNIQESVVGDTAALGRLPAQRAASLHLRADNLKTFALVEAAYRARQAGKPVSAREPARMTADFRATGTHRARA